MTRASAHVSLRLGCPQCPRAPLALRDGCSPWRCGTWHVRTHANVQP
jgi:hypothetical protein